MKTKEIDNILDDLICETGMEPDGKRLGITTTEQLVNKLRPILEKRISTLRQSVLEEVREKMPEKTEDYDNVDFPNITGEAYDEGFNNCHDQVTSLINNLIEEK